MRKYLFGLPSGRTTETFAVFVQADIPQDSADITFVFRGMTAKVFLVSAASQFVESIRTINNSLVDKEISLNPRLPFERV